MLLPQGYGRSGMPIRAEQAWIRSPVVNASCASRPVSGRLAGSRQGRGRSVNAGAHKPPRGSLTCAPQRPCQLNAGLRHGMIKPRERTGANGSGYATGLPPAYARMRALTDVTSETLRRWREAQGWDVPRMARELRKAAKVSGEDVAAHHGLVKMIPQWERGNRAPRERYRLLYVKIFKEALGDLSHGMELANDLA